MPQSSNTSLKKEHHIFIQINDKSIRGITSSGTLDTLSTKSLKYDLIK